MSSESPSPQRHLSPNIHGCGSSAALEKALVSASDNSRSVMFTLGSPECPHCKRWQEVVVAAAPKLPQADFINYNVSSSPEETRAVLEDLGLADAVRAVPKMYVIRASDGSVIPFDGERSEQAVLAAMQ